MADNATMLSRLETQIAALSGWRASGVAALAGAFAALGYAPLFFAPAFIVGIVTLVWLLDAAFKTPRKLRAFFARGWWWGFGHCLAGMYWIASPFLVDSTAWGPLWAGPCVLLFCGGLALFYGAGAMLAGLLWTRDARRIAAFALGLALSEYARGNVFTGFPWNLPAYIWEAGSPVSQLAAVIGAYGLSAATLLIAATPATLMDRAPNQLRRLAPILAAALAIGLAWGWGAARMGTSASANPLPGETPVVRVADSGMTQAEKWTIRDDQEWRVLARYMRVTGAEGSSRADIVIWPEGAIPAVNFFLLENPDFLRAIGRGLGDRVLITGLSRRVRAHDHVLYYNSALVIDGVSGAARLSQVYDKNHLVPFGEYIPFWPTVSAAAAQLNRWGVPVSVGPLQEIGDGFQAGDPPGRFILPDAPPAAPIICYEAIFPGMIPRGAERPGWVVNVSNDAWFGAGAGPRQHFNIARYRAIEEGLPLARAASGGVSAIVDPYGRVVRETGLRGGFAEAQLPKALAETPYAQFHFWLTAAVFALIATLRFAPWGRRREGNANV